MTRYVCAWFPNWPLQRLCAVQAELKGCPVVLYAELPRQGKCVAYSSLAAFRMGVRPCMPLAEAQAILDRPGERRRLESHILLHDSAADREFLERLAEHCQRYAPRVGIDDFGPPDTLTLDITGCAEHFGGEAELARQMQQTLGQFVFQIGIADTLGAAWGVSRVAPSHSQASVEIIPPGQQQAALSPLPVSALRLPPNVLESLDELGLQTVGQLLALPRHSLPSRFGIILTQRLDEALGGASEIIVPLRAPEAVTADWSFESPLSDRSLLQTALRQLLTQLLETLATQQSGLQRLQIELTCTGGDVVHVLLGSLRPSASIDHWHDLLRLQLERLQVPAEVVRLHLEVIAMARLEIQAPSLFDDGGDRENQRHLLELLDRLNNRLGESAVLRPELRPDAQPEYACRCLSLTALPVATKPRTEKSCTERSASTPFSALARPLLLKPAPLPLLVTATFPEGSPSRFEWEEKLHTVAHCWGPERIETGWWRGHVARDYYRVETDQGRQFWLFHETEQGTWFLHGVFE